MSYLALLPTFEWLVEKPVLEAVAGCGSLGEPFNRAAGSGPVEAVHEPAQRARRVHVSPLLRPLLAAELADPGRAELWSGARSGREADRQLAAIPDLHQRCETSGSARAFEAIRRLRAR